MLLAAGSGSRFVSPSGHKLRHELRGRTLFAWALGPALQAGLDEVIVVSGAVALDDLVPDGVTLLHNEAWREGQSTSLQVAVDWAARRSHAAVVVGLGDLPGLTVEAWRAVATATEAPVVAASYEGRRAHPVRLAAEVWPLLPPGGDEGARALWRSHPEIVVELPCVGDPSDIDTWEELRRWS